MDKDEAIAVINELLLPLRLAGVSCSVTGIGNVLEVTIDSSSCMVVIVQNFKRRLMQMCNSFSMSFRGEDTRFICYYFQAYISNSQKALDSLLEE